MAGVNKPKLGCVCTSPSPSVCMGAIEAGFETDYQCGCACHMTDLDGETAWDKYFDRLKKYSELVAQEGTTQVNENGEQHA